MSFNFLNFLNKTAEMISNKDINFNKLKDKISSNKSINITFPISFLRQIIDDFEFIIKTSLDAIETIKENSFNNENHISNQITFSPFTYKTTETNNTLNIHTLEDTPNINDTIQNYTKDLNLQFDYSTYAGLYSLNQPSFKDDETPSENIIRNNENNKENSKMNEIEYESMDIDYSRVQKGLRHMIKTTMTKPINQSNLFENNLLRKNFIDSNYKKTIQSNKSIDNILKEIENISAENYFSNKYSNGLYKTFIKKLVNSEFDIDHIKEEIRNLKNDSKRNYSIRKSNRSNSKSNFIRVTKSQRGIYNEPVKLEKLLRKYSFNK